MALLYLSSFLPKRSETFVYREVLGLRKMGVDVRVASLYAPESGLGDRELDLLAAEVLTVYPQGFPRLFKDAFFFILSNPLQAMRTFWTALLDSLSDGHLKFKERFKVIFQAVPALALARRIQETGDVRGIHVHMAHAPATIGMYAAHALGIPFSFTGHAADLFRDGTLIRQKLTRAVFVSCISRWHSAWYQSIVPRSSQDYPVIRCGVSIPEVPAQTLPGSVLRILGLARLVSKKGFDVLITAVGTLVSERIPIDCCIAGDGPERSSLEALAKRLGVERQIRFVGAVSNADVPALLAGTDLMVLPCRVSADGDRDGIPVALMEAMASGICVVSGDLPTIRELIEDQRTGVLVPPGNAEALASVIRKLWIDPKLRLRLASAGRVHVQEEFSSIQNLDRLMNNFLAHHCL